MTTIDLPQTAVTYRFSSVHRVAGSLHYAKVETLRPTQVKAIRGSALRRSPRALLRLQIETLHDRSWQSIVSSCQTLSSEVWKMKHRADSGEDAQPFRLKVPSCNGRRCPRRLAVQRSSDVVT